MMPDYVLAEQLAELACPRCPGARLLVVVFIFTQLAPASTQPLSSPDIRVHRVSALNYWANSIRLHP